MSEEGFYRKIRGFNFTGFVTNNEILSIEIELHNYGRDKLPLLEKVLVTSEILINLTKTGLG